MKISNLNFVTSEEDRDPGSSSIENMVMFVREYLYSSGQLVAVHMFDDINWSNIAPWQAMTFCDVFWSRNR